MFRRLAISALGLALLVSPSFVAADTSIADQIAALLAQIKVLQAQIAQLQGQSSTSCVDIHRNLTLGSTGSDVTTLQNYLTAKNYFSGSATGYYGFITAQAVGKLQMDLGIVSSQSDPAFGIMGPKTRSAIACNTTTLSKPSAKFSATPMWGTAPLTVNFSFPAGEGLIVDFGDGQKSSGGGCGDCGGTKETQSHTYTSAGTYSASLIKPAACHYDASGPVCLPETSIGTVTITVTSGSSAQPSATIDQSSLTASNKTPTITGTVSGTSQISIYIWPGNVIPPQSESAAYKLQTVWSTGSSSGHAEISISNGRWQTGIGGTQVAGGGAPNPYMSSGTYTVGIYDGNNLHGQPLLASGTLTVTGSPAPSISITSISGYNVTARVNASGDVGDASIEVIDQSTGNTVDYVNLAELHADAGGSVSFTLPSTIPSGTYVLGLSQVSRSYPAPKSDPFTLGTAATIDQSSLSANSATIPTITGTASGVKELSLVITAPGANGLSTSYPIWSVPPNGHWSRTLTSFLNPSLYKVQLYSYPDDSLLASGTLTVTGETIVGTATIDQSALTQSQGSFTLTGTASNLQGGVQVWVVGPGYTGATDFNALFGQLGNPDVHSLGTSLTAGVWRAPFTWNGGPTTFKVLVFDPVAKTLLTSGTLSVSQ